MRRARALLATTRPEPSCTTTASWTASSIAAFSWSPDFVSARLERAPLDARRARGAAAVLLVLVNPLKLKASPKPR